MRQLRSSATNCTFSDRQAPGAKVLRKLVVVTDSGHWPQSEDAPSFDRIHIDVVVNG